GLLVTEPPLVAVGNGVEGGAAVRSAGERTGVAVALVPGGHAGEEPQLVLDDVATQRRSEITDVVEVALAGDHRGSTGGGGDGGLAGQGAGSEVAPPLPVELVSTRLGGRAQRSAGGPSVLRHVATGDDVDLVEELRGERAAQHAVGRVVHRQAVDQVLVLG